MTKAMYDHHDDYKKSAPDANGWAWERQKLEHVLAKMQKTGEGVRTVFEAHIPHGPVREAPLGGHAVVHLDQLAVTGVRHDLPVNSIDSCRGAFKYLHERPVVLEQQTGQAIPFIVEAGLRQQVIQRFSPDLPDRR
ncbi:MAG: hypothetical protein P1U65_13335 [Minwuia sp.]|nr:hypothetical protein [Minwuia sp.]